MTTCARPAWIFRRLLGVVYVCAFWSMVVQLDGLFGSDGILPARDFMQAAREWTGADGLGLARFHVVPTLFWISTSDGFMSAVCIVGVVGGVLLAVGVAPLITAALPWIAYLSLMTVGQVFLGYPVGRAAARDRSPRGVPGAARLARPAARRGRRRYARVWLFRWLLFRLMFASGAVKLVERRSHLARASPPSVPLRDAAAADLGRLVRAPASGVVLNVLTRRMFVVELVAPFLIFGARRLRLIACRASRRRSRSVIALTGNYAFFNLLAIALCVLLLDDAMRAARPPSADAHAGRARVRALAVAAARPLPVSIAGVRSWSSAVRPAPSRSRGPALTAVRSRRSTSSTATASSR